MGSIVQIVLLGALVGALSLGLLSYKTTRIYNIVFALLVFLASIPFAVLAARTLKTHQSWRMEVVKEEKELADLGKQIQQVTEGDVNSTDAARVANPTGDEPGAEYPSSSIRELRLALHRMAVNRGGVWRDLQVTNVSAVNGSVTLLVNNPEPHGVAEKMVLFLFDANQYLGEFKVTGTKAKEVQLVPNLLPMEPADLRHLAESAERRSAWMLYQAMPIDDPRVTASLTDEERAKSLPKELVEEFAQPTRAPRDYQAMFHNAHQRLALLATQITEINENLQLVQSSLTKVNADIQFREQEKTSLDSDLKGFQREQEAVAAYVQQLQSEVTAARGALKAVYLSTRRLAAEVVELQLKAAERINLAVNRAATGGPTSSP